MKRMEELNLLTPWAINIPREWEVLRLDNVADVIFSNVDKHTIEDERPVRLCNYVDVYKNDLITKGINFMEATAELREIEKFQLHTGDVIITKDSEESNDIAICALVAEELPNVICGYHLALIRPRSKKITGEFIAWLHRSKQFRAQYEAKAIGVTRFGLSQYVFRSALIPVPPAEEQNRINIYLHRICSAIDSIAVVGKQKDEDSRLKGLLNKQMLVLREYRNSLIHECVTGKMRVTEKDLKETVNV